MRQGKLVKLYETHFGMYGKTFEEQSLNAKIQHPTCHRSVV